MAGRQVYTGGIDNSVKVWDLRKEEVVHMLAGHTDTITGMSVSPDGSHLLTNSMDNTLREWDMRPYAPEDRCTKAGGHARHRHADCPRFTSCAHSSCVIVICRQWQNSQPERATSNRDLPPCKNNCTRAEGQR